MNYHLSAAPVDLISYNRWLCLEPQTGTSPEFRSEPAGLLSASAERPDNGDLILSQGNGDLILSQGKGASGSEFDFLGRGICAWEGGLPLHASA